MARKKKEAPPPPPKKRDDAPRVEEGLPGWMATFADMMTLLLCFFVLLLSFANQDITKFRTLMGSIKDAFGVQVKRPDAEFAAFSPSQFERKDVELDEQNKMLLGMVLQLKKIVVEDPELSKSADITTDDQGVIMRVPNSIMFDPGTPRLAKSSAPVLSKVITFLKENNLDLVVRGHTDDQPVDSTLYPSNWELSSARSGALLRQIITEGEIKSTRLKAVGYADSQPLVPNNTQTNRFVNNRTEFYFHRPSVNTW